MKKHTIFICLFLQLAITFAQAPEKMSYQPVVRNNNKVLVSNHAVGMRISILQGSATGTAVYTENQTPTTNAIGLIAIEIGTGTVVAGTFANIDWANGPYFVKTETDPNGGTSYSLTANNQLLSVPYALYAKTAQTALNGVPQGGLQGQFLTMCDGQLVWTSGGGCPAKIAGFNCADTVHTGYLYANVASGASVNSTISYSGGNGGIYTSQSISSNGVTGLTATLASGTLNNGNGTLSFTITGTPTTTGIASFYVNFAGKTCTFYRTISASPTYPANSVYCNGTPTAIVEVTNPITGKAWMDRNLGASRAATSFTDTLAYGDLYQWGRGADGHQCRNSSNIFILSSTDTPSHSGFIIASNIPFDWQLSPNNNLWQGVNGINNPCPNGYRLPTHIELENERLSWSQNNGTGAMNSPLKIPMGGYRDGQNGSSLSIVLAGSRSYLWSSTVNIDTPWELNTGYGSSGSNNNYSYKSKGMSVRCIRN